jgi:hypothetical protein
MLGFWLLAVTARQQRAGITVGLGSMPAAWFITSAFAFTVAILAGAWLLRRHRYGATLSIAVQVAQVAKFTVPGMITYQFSSGLNLLVTMSPSGIGIGPGVAANFAVFPMSIAPSWMVSIDLLALTSALILLGWSGRPDEFDAITAGGADTRVTMPKMRGREHVGIHGDVP